MSTSRGISKARLHCTRVPQEQRAEKERKNFGSNAHRGRLLRDKSPCKLPVEALRMESMASPAALAPAGSVMGSAPPRCPRNALLPALPPSLPPGLNSG